MVRGGDRQHFRIGAAACCTLITRSSAPTCPRPAHRAMRPQTHARDTTLWLGARARSPGRPISRQSWPIEPCRSALPPRPNMASPLAPLAWRSAGRLGCVSHLAHLTTPLMSSWTLEQALPDCIAIDLAKWLFWEDLEGLQRPPTTAAPAICRGRGDAVLRWIGKMHQHGRYSNVLVPGKRTPSLRNELCYCCDA
jgi:hypothetical protein